MLLQKSMFMPTFELVSLRYICVVRCNFLCWWVVVQFGLSRSKLTAQRLECVWISFGGLFFWWKLSLSLKNGCFFSGDVRLRSVSPWTLVFISRSSVHSTTKWMERLACLDGLFWELIEKNLVCVWKNFTGFLCQYIFLSEYRVNPQFVQFLTE